MFKNDEYVTALEEQVRNVMKCIDRATALGHTRTCFSPSHIYKDEVMAHVCGQGTTRSSPPDILAASGSSAKIFAGNSKVKNGTSIPSRHIKR
jgi:hypothetical protein